MPAARVHPFQHRRFRTRIYDRQKRLAPAGVWTSERARAYKPRREIFESGLKAFGLRPEEALYLGDSLRNDYFGARGAGILSVWLNRLGETVPSGVELWAPDLYSALPIVEEWKNAE